MESVFEVVGIETIHAKKGGTFYKVYLKEDCENNKNLKGCKVKDYFITFYPNIEVGDVVELIFGCGYDARAYLKEIRKV